MAALARAKMAPRAAPEDAFLVHLKCIEFLSAILCAADARTIAIANFRFGCLPVLFRLFIILIWAFLRMAWANNNSRERLYKSRCGKGSVRISRPYYSRSINSIDRLIASIDYRIAVISLAEAHFRGGRVVEHRARRRRCRCCSSPISRDQVATLE